LLLLLVLLSVGVTTLFIASAVDSAAVFGSPRNASSNALDEIKS
jgi:hypothetical protein